MTSYFAAHSATCYLDRAFTSHSSRISPSMPSCLPMPALPCDDTSSVRRLVRAKRTKTLVSFLPPPPSLRSPSPSKSFRKTTTASLFRSPFRRRLGLARRPVLQEPGPSRRRRRRRRSPTGASRCLRSSRASSGPSCTCPRSGLSPRRSGREAEGSSDRRARASAWR